MIFSDQVKKFTNGLKLYNYAFDPQKKSKALTGYNDDPAAVSRPFSPDPKHGIINGKIKNIIQRASAGFINLVESVILPKSRSIIIKEDVETGYVIQAPVKIAFPWFTLFICILEIMMYCVGRNLQTSDIVCTCSRVGRGRNCNILHVIWESFILQFTRNSVWNLLVNICIQMIFGLLLEMGHGTIAASLYMNGITIGYLAKAYLTQKGLPHQASSAGVFAWIAAHFSTLIMNWQEMKGSVWRLLLGFIGFSALSLAYSFDCSPYKLDSQVANISGVITGFLLGAWGLNIFRIQAWKMSFRKVCFLFGIFFEISMCFVYIYMKTPTSDSIFTCHG